jgi:hypothetical protein
MDTPEDANAAIEKFNGTTQEGKVMTVAHVRYDSTGIENNADV